jgi:hypothetical protein
MDESDIEISSYWSPTQLSQKNNAKESFEHRNWFKASLAEHFILF